MADLRDQIEKLEKDQAWDSKIIEGIKSRLDQFEAELREGKEELSRNVQYEVVEQSHGK